MIIKRPALTPLPAIVCCTCWVAIAIATARADDSHASARELAPQDFAYGRVVELPAGDAALVQIELPVDVYRNSRTQGLQDVLVFNARGAQVPHALRTASPQPIATRETRSLPLFPVPLAAQMEGQAQQPSGRIDMAVSIERSAQGQVLRITSRTAPSDQQAKSQPIVAYLLDARTLPRALVRLNFELADAADDLVLPVAIDASSDLLDWSGVAVAGALLHLKHAEHSIERAQLEIAPTQREFLRVRPLGVSVFPVSISSVSGVLAADAPPHVLARVDAIGRPVAAKSGVYRFDLGGAVPVDRIELELPEDNTVIAAELWSAQRVEGPYQHLVDAHFYRIVAAGKPLSGPTLDLARLHSRYYELRVDTTRPALGTGQPRLLTYHAPDQLLFLRRGDAPFTLAYGRHDVARQRFEADDLLTLVDASRAKATPLVNATLLPAAALGGSALLDAPKPAPPYKTYVLWSALVAGVALLAALAYRLIRGGV